ncbi:hypothetical protein ACF0H5_007692 [Mactra antiquata]
MDRRTLVLLLNSLWIVYVSGYVPLTLTDCGSTANRLLNIQGNTVDYPIEIPGHVKARGTVDILHDVQPDRYTLNVTVEKWIVFNYFTLPCVSNVGSCSYDVCDLLGKFEGRGGCPWQLVESNFPCMCPFSNATHTLQPLPFYIPEVQGIWSWIAFGDFRVTGTLYDNVLSEIVNCYQLEFTVQRKPIVIEDFWGWW